MDSPSTPRPFGIDVATQFWHQGDRDHQPPTPDAIKIDPPPPSPELARAFTLVEAPQPWCSPAAAARWGAHRLGDLAVFLEEASVTADAVRQLAGFYDDVADLDGRTPLRAQLVISREPIAAAAEGC